MLAEYVDSNTVKLNRNQCLKAKKTFLLKLYQHKQNSLSLKTSKKVEEWIDDNLETLKANKDRNSSVEDMCRKCI